MVEWRDIYSSDSSLFSHIWYKLKHLHQSIFFCFFKFSSCAGCTQKTTAVTLSLYKQVDVLDRETSRRVTFTTGRVWLKLWIIVEPLLLSVPFFCFLLLSATRRLSMATPTRRHMVSDSWLFYSLCCHIHLFSLSPPCSCSSLTYIFFFISPRTAEVWWDFGVHFIAANGSVLQRDIGDCSVIVHIQGAMVATVHNVVLA